MYKVGLSSCGKTLNEQFFAECSQTGINAIEISPEWNEYKDIDYPSLLRLSKQYNVALWSFHLPYPTTDICSSNREIRMRSVNYMCELIEKASNIGIRYFVVHSGREPVSFEPEERAQAMACSKESLNLLADFAANYGSVICLEDLPRSCLGNTSTEILELISVNEKLRVCLDTNHLLKEDNADFIRAVGNKIVTLHVSDYDFVDERHWLPGKGKVDWKRMINVLEDVDYEGRFLYEIDWDDLTFADVAENYKQLMSL